MLSSVNPHNNKLIRNYKEDSPRQLEQKLQASHTAFSTWRTSSFAERASFLRSIAKEVLKRKDDLVRLMAVEMGKPVTKGMVEVEKCAWVCNHYATLGKEMLADEPVETKYSKSFVTYNPLGTVFGIMPWNYPFWQVFRGLTPALMAGNTFLLKHAANVTGCALAIQDICNEVQGRSKVFDILVTDYHAVDRILEHKAIAAVTLTGSTYAGKAVAAKAGSLLKKSVMELGGSDAYMILADADVEMAAAECAASRLKNGGQSCISAKRFIVDTKLVARFTGRMIANMDKIRFGNPLDRSFDLGPLARIDLKHKIDDQVRKSISKGARLAWNGPRDNSPGAYYPCTVLTGVEPGMPAFDEEVFGPVAAIIEAKDEDHAIRLANQSVYGLGGAVFSKNLKKAERIASKLIEAGTVFVNVQVNSDPRLPFGGIKESGYGRELGTLGIKEFVNIKSIAVR